MLPPQALAAAAILSIIPAPPPWDALFAVGTIFFLFLAFYGLRVAWKRYEELRLERFRHNPLLVPGHHYWESQAVFNPATIYVGGKVHLLYRAIGDDGISRIGYAASEDGIHFKERLPYPVLALENPRRESKACLRQEYNPVLYPSGGSWGGCEDPRAVVIDDRVYLSFNAFDGWDFLRIGVVSLHLAHFLGKRWKWSEPLFISPKGEIHKNWLLFPEKFDGKFAILHTITPEVRVDYVDRLEDLASGKEIIKSERSQSGPRDSWDSWVRGAGPPPIRTKYGWLVLYHAVDAREWHKYKIGALLLDLNDPRIIIARSKGPVLEPDMWYENDWKPGIVYACGALVKDGTLFVYYGGGDKTVCAATIPLTELLDALLASRGPQFSIQGISFK